MFTTVTYKSISWLKNNTKEGGAMNEVLSKIQEDNLRKAFLFMARVNEDGNFTREVAKWNDMPIEVHSVLERLVEGRLLVSGGGEANQRTIQVAHETIFRSWKRLKKWFAEHKLIDSSIPILGSGGNINKIYKQQRRRNTDMHITTAGLRQFYEQMKPLTYTERIIQYNLNPDRADVIIPACEIFLSIIEFTSTKKIYVPKIGLSDGIVRSLYQEYLKKK